MTSYEPGSETRVFDCFCFSTELDLLEFRLDLLNRVVDRFVLVEATRTHSGLSKALTFDENKARFGRYAHMIEHVVVENLPDPVPDRWVPEHFQREAIERGLSTAHAHDVVMINDLDEIPDPRVVAELRRDLVSTVQLDLRPCYFRGNWESSFVWPLARAARRRAFSSPQQLRDSTPTTRVREAGAHFSYLMSEEHIARKLGAFAHTEYDTDRGTSVPYISLTVATGLFGPREDLLMNRCVDELSAVQLALLDRHPDLFSFAPFPPLLLRRAIRKYTRVRVAPWIPLPVINATDRLARRVINGFARQRSG